MDKSELAIRGAAAAQVDKRQTRRLALAARSAYAEQTRLGLADGTFDEWRRGVLWDAVRRASFRTLGQAEFGKALAAFLALAGRDAPSARGAWGRTNAAIARRETSPEGDRARALFKLREACAEAADVFGGEPQALCYAAELLRRIHWTDMERATAKQLWQTFFTVRNRAAAKRKAAAKVNGQELTGKSF